MPWCCGLDQSPHAAYLVLALVTVTVACALDLRDREHLVVPGINVPLPGLCAYHEIVRYDCPGCGLTRSFVCLADGDIAAAWSYNAAGLIFFVVVVFQIPYRTIQLWRISRGRPAIRCCSPHWVVWLLVTALMAQWLLRSIGQLTR